MSDQITTGPVAGDGGTEDSKVGAAKGVAERTAGRASDVAGEATEQAKVVAREAKDHVRDLVDRGRSDLGDEASARSQQAAGSVRTLADRVGALASGDPDSSGPLADLLREGQDRLQTFAGRLDDGPAAVLDDVRSFARRQPVLFLASAGAIGFLVGRLARATRDQSQDAASTDDTAGRELAPPVLPGAPLPLPGDASATGVGVDPTLVTP